MEWRVVGASATGANHVSSGVECQDALGWTIDPRGIVCLAVADGAGSRPRSADGSAAAVAAVLDWAATVEAPPEEPLREPFDEAVAALHERASAEGVPLTDIATTLAVVVITARRVLVGQIGDSIVVLRRGTGELVRAQPEESFEYVNQTRFITDEGAMDAIRSDVFDADGIEAVALSTDGLRYQIVEDLASGRPFEPFFDDVFTWPTRDDATIEAVARFLDRLNDQMGDDKTLVVAARTALPVPEGDRGIERVFNPRSCVPMSLKRFQPDHFG